jgi:hypothetical protein
VCVSRQTSLSLLNHSICLQRSINKLVYLICHVSHLISRLRFHTSEIHTIRVCLRQAFIFSLYYRVLDSLSPLRHCTVNSSVLEPVHLLFCVPFDNHLAMDTRLNSFLSACNDATSNESSKLGGGRQPARSVLRRASRSKSKSRRRRATSLSRSRSRTRGRSGSVGDAFLKQLHSLGYAPATYLSNARKAARRSGYDPSKLHFANNNNNKLVYESPEGNKYFGKAGYGDYLIWSFKERRGQARTGYASMKRRVFRTSHGEITRIYNLNKFSPNELSIHILW